MSEAGGTFRGHGGLAIHWRRAMPDGRPRGVVLLSHGYAEHVGRYRVFKQHLAARGIAAVGIDHRGHGRSEGPRGHVGDFDEFVADLRTLADHVDDWWPGVPRLLFGHSMGGLIGFLYLLRHPTTVRAGALSGPAFRVPAPGPRWQLAVARALGRIAPRVPFTSALDAEALSRDPAVGRAYVADPLVHRRATAGFVRAIGRAQERAFASAPSLAVPTLILQGDADRLVSPSGALEMAARLPKGHVVEMLAGYYHELLNEPAPERARVVERLDAWLDRHLSA
jgi:alpha-beta hydrolase superfamily lysophospholipase